MNQDAQEQIVALIAFIHHDGKEHPFESGRLAALAGRVIDSNPWVDGSAPAEGFNTGFRSIGVGRKSLALLDKEGAK